MKKPIVALLASLVCAAAAQAAGSSFGPVNNVTQFGSTALYRVGGVATGTPVCAFSNPGRYAIDVRTVVGQAFQRHLEQAAALGRSVLMQGTGTCTIEPNFEDLFYVGFDLR